MAQFVFSHGFGFNVHFWDNLSSFFSKENCLFIDWGYFKKPTPLLKFPEKNIIGIGHSLGFSKLTHLHENFSCLIGLNSFTHFLGHDKLLYQKRYLELKALKRNLIKNPAFTLQKFYERCGIPQFIEYCSIDNLDINLMLHDFTLLQQSIALPLIPTLILNTDDDIVVNKELTEDNFYNTPHVELDIIPQAKHGLGFIKPLDVYEKIMSFLDENFDK